MQTTLSATLIDPSDEVIQKLNQFNALFNTTQRKLYKDIVSYYTKHNTSTLSKTKINDLKSFYQQLYNINSRHYNSVYSDLIGKISSVLALNKDYLADTKDNIIFLETKLKSKQKILDNLLVKINHKNYIVKHIDNVNLSSLKYKIYYIKKQLNKANNKLIKLEYIEKTGNPHLCFGSKKLFNQQFLIDKPNNLTKFKNHNDWKKAWEQSRHQTFVMVGSKDETLGNTNCQIKHIENDIYELKVNIHKALGLKEKYLTFQIKLYNDKNGLIKNAINAHLNNDIDKIQPITYRFYKDYKHNTYKVFISLDKSKQATKTITNKILGCIGVDINHDHLSVCEINRHGNLIKTWDLPLNLKGKSSDQSLDNIACAVKEITDYAVSVNKPIVIEKLNFSSKKKTLKDNYKNKFNKKYNVMLSSFAYRKILELIKSRAFDKGIETIEVNPSYTSKIGKFKYQNLYKLTTHQAASFVIARRGFFSYTKLKFNKIVKFDKKTEKEYKEILVVYKEKAISIRSSKYYPFGLPARNNQKQEGIYWKEIEQCVQKVKNQRISLKRKKRSLGKQKVVESRLKSETNLVTEHTEVYRDLNPNLLFSPF